MIERNQFNTFKIKKKHVPKYNIHNSYLENINSKGSVSEKQNFQYCSISFGGTCSFFIKYFIMRDLKDWISALTSLNTPLTQSVHLPLGFTLV